MYFALRSTDLVIRSHTFFLCLILSLVRRFHPILASMGPHSCLCSSPVYLLTSWGPTLISLLQYSLIHNWRTLPHFLEHSLSHSYKLSAFPLNSPWLALCNAIPLHAKKLWERRFVLGHLAHILLVLISVHKFCEHLVPGSLQCFFRCQSCRWEVEGANVSITRQAHEFKEVVEICTCGASVKGWAGQLTLYCKLFNLPSIIDPVCYLLKNLVCMYERAES